MPAPVTALPLRPLSKRASTASWSIRFSLFTITSGAPRSSRRRSRLFLFMTLRYRSLRSLGGEAAAVELDHRAQVRRQDGDGLHDHPLGAVAAHAERVNDLEALDGLLALLALGGGDGIPEVLGLVFEVHLAYEVPYGLGSHAAPKVHAVAVLVAETVLHLAEELLVVHDLARLQRLEFLPGAPDEPYLLGNGAADVSDGLLGLLVDLRYGRVAVLLGDVRVLLGQLVGRALALYDALALGPEGLDLVYLLVPVQL